MNCLAQKWYPPWIQSSPWRDVLRPLLSSSDKREEVAGKKKKENGMSVQVVTGEARKQRILNTWSSPAAMRSHLYRQSKIRFFLFFIFFSYHPLHCRIALTPQALPTATISQMGTSLLTMEASLPEIAITGTLVSMHLGYFTCLLRRRGVHLAP